MPEHGPGGDGYDMALAFQALLYACDELDGAEAARFEARLGEDQTAREALCQAVQLAHAQTGAAPLRPDPAYRERVRQAVRAPGGVWRWLTGRRYSRGHPAAWSAIGAAAAVLLMVVLGFGGSSEAPAPLAGVPAPRKTEPPPKPAVTNRPRPRPPATSTAEARAWAELQGNMRWRKRLWATAGVKH